MSKILVIDDEVQIRSLLARMLGLEAMKYVRPATARLLSNSWRHNRLMWRYAMSFFLMEMG